MTGTAGGDGGTGGGGVREGQRDMGTGGVGAGGER